jgi:general secretion pathway protein J
MKGDNIEKRGPHGKLAPGRRSERGFTLLELTVSIALIGIIVLIVVGAMRLGLRSIESGEKRTESLERIRSSLGIIDSQIQSFVPLTYIEDGEKKFYFTGTGEFMEFATNYSVWGGEKGFVIASYSIQPSETGRQVLSVSETVAGREDKRETKLIDSFEKIYIEYFYKDPVEEEGRWIDQWTETQLTPEKVRIHLVTGSQDLAMIIPLRVKASALDLAESGSFMEEEE